MPLQSWTILPRQPRCRTIPTWGNQWSLAQIGLPEAWNVTTGSPGIIIAVVDSGLYLGHPDLAGKVWTNPGEIPGNWDRR